MALQMNIITGTVALIAASVLVLTGRSPSTGVAEPGPTTPNQTQSPQADAQPARGDQRAVTTIEVIDAVTIKVTPRDESDSLYGTEFLVHVSGINAPAKGQCGYDEGVEYATAVLTERPAWLEYANSTLTREQQDTFQWIDPVGGHTGALSNNGPLMEGYAMSLIEKGLATAQDGATAYLAHQKRAQEKNIGLWATCKGFGQQPGSPCAFHAVLALGHPDNQQHQSRRRREP